MFMAVIFHRMFWLIIVWIEGRHSGLGPILDCLLRPAWSRRTINVLFPTFTSACFVPAVCVHFFFVVLSHCMWFVFTSCSLPVSLLPWPLLFVCFLLLFGCDALMWFCHWSARVEPNSSRKLDLWWSPSTCLEPCFTHPVPYLCAPFRVCVDIFPDSALVTSRSF